MRIEALRIEGLRHASDWSQDDLGEAVALPAAPAGIAVADGIALLAAALDPRRTEAILDRCALGGPELELYPDDHGMPEQVGGLNAAEVEALLHPEGGRRAVITARLALDPPLFGQLREESMRDPRMLAALGAEPVLTIKVGWLFTADHSATSVSVLDVKVADTTFPTGRSERPRWMDGLLRSVGRRLGGVGARDDLARVGARLLAASLSPKASVRASFARLSEALEGPPFALGRLELVRAGADAATPCFGPELVRARQLGPRALRALRVAEAALVEAPDVLVGEDDAASGWTEWLTALTTGERATLEQVFWLPSDG